MYKHYENKYFFFNFLSESPKPEITKPKIPKLKTPKLISSKLKISKLKIPKPKPRPEIRFNNKKLKKIRKDFDELRQV